MKHFPYYTRWDYDLLRGKYILFFDPVLERFKDQIGHRFRLLDPSIRNVDLVIFRGRTADFTEKLHNDPNLTYLLHDTPAVALIGCIQGQTSPQYLEISTQQTSDSFLPDLEIIREFEIQSILYNSRAIYSSEDYHFSLPSRLHASAFIRLADALQDPVDVTRIADWIFGSLTARSVVIGDTGSLLPLLLTIQIESLKQFGLNIAIRTIYEYPYDTQLLNAIINDAKLALGIDGGHILFLVSVNSSGSLAKQLNSISDQHSYKFDMVVVCNTGTTEYLGDATILSTMQVDRYDEDKCALCENSIAVSIDPRTYERIPSVDWLAENITPKAAKDHREFWQAVDRSDAVYLHVNRDYPEADSGKIRHHGVYVDIARLISDHWARNKIANKLRDYCSPRLVIIPKHSTSEALCEIVSEVHSSSAISIIDHGSFNEEIIDILRSLNESDTVLVLDDALVTGTTLHRIHEDLYKLTQHTRPKIKAFVLLARTVDEATYNMLYQRYRDDRLPDEDLLASVFKIYLPPPHECPWCKEQQLLLQYLPTLDQRSQDYVNTRLEKLMDMNGLKAPFLIGTEGQEWETTKTKGSIFGELNPITAFSAATAACQKLRQSMSYSNLIMKPPKMKNSCFHVIYNAFTLCLNKLLRKLPGSNANNLIAQRNGGPLIHVLNLQKVITYHYDSVLLAAVLRTFSVKEIRYRGHEKKVIESLRLKHPDRAYPGIITELGWAAVNNKIPKEPVLELLSGGNRNDPCVWLLTKLLMQDN